MRDLLLNNSYFFLLLTLLAFSLGRFIQKKGKIALLNPLLIGALLIILFLKITGISNSSYQAGCRILSFLLTPATICLAISFYEQFQSLKKHMTAMSAGLILGSICCMGSVYLLCKIRRIRKSVHEPPTEAERGSAAQK